ncbi:LytR family transcriptional regulator [Streptomyces radicis]|uniref:LytR family transcriptional regulator n=2 Tax=Streptomyces radicis TaxID=1750517 RepID=A0A3A9WM21_9ACTN|nr:LytR family transcriptional regulator [Streptomyces radicis]RKN26872.1 LytR family transcriptional regulator [Streptomyces radicis]
MGGKKFRVTGDRYPRMRPRRRRGRAAFLLVAGVTALGMLGYGTLQLVDVFSGDDDGGRAPRAQAGARAGEDCTPASTAERLPEPAAITVNVFNATARTGLAQDTADALAERGFTIGEVANAPEEYDGQVNASGLLVGTAQTEESGALTVLATQLDGVETAEPRQPAGEEEPPRVVDLMIGEGFTELTAADEAERRLAELTAPPAADASPAC